MRAVARVMVIVVGCVLRIVYMKCELITNASLRTRTNRRSVMCNLNRKCELYTNVG